MQSESVTDAAGKSKIKQTMGRQRIAIAKIDDKARRQTTFTKRRTGLFKKVRELCELCNAEAAVITLSEVHNIFANGTPSVDAVLNRYLATNPSSDADTEQAENDGDETGEELKNLQERLADAMRRLEVERQKGEYLKKALGLIDGGGSSSSMDESEEALALEELLQLQDKWTMRSASRFPEIGN